MSERDLASEGAMALWEAKFDALGPIAPLSTLDQMLHSAPSPGAAVDNLSGYLAGRRICHEYSPAEGEYQCHGSSGNSPCCKK